MKKVIVLTSLMLCLNAQENIPTWAKECQVGELKSWENDYFRACAIANSIDSQGQEKAFKEAKETLMRNLKQDPLIIEYQNAIVATKEQLERTIKEVQDSSLTQDSKEAYSNTLDSLNKTLQGFLDDLKTDLDKVQKEILARSKWRYQETKEYYVLVSARLKSLKDKIPSHTLRLRSATKQFSNIEKKVEALKKMGAIQEVKPTVDTEKPNNEHGQTMQWVKHCGKTTLKQTTAESCKSAMGSNMLDSMKYATENARKALFERLSNGIETLNYENNFVARLKQPLNAKFQALVPERSQELLNEILPESIKDFVYNTPIKAKAYQNGRAFVLIEVDLKILESKLKEIISTFK
ncbi:hypothetical protein [Helicobacter cetorum]|uniref:hypothetical protein n=1 Tax=Helicobacter cetorum TaxID=138563 RepID=UPI000CF12183|nr:hypothetical protein [Helicobacter cetorum]